MAPGDGWKVRAAVTQGMSGGLILLATPAAALVAGLLPAAAGIEGEDTLPGPVHEPPVGKAGELARLQQVVGRGVPGGEYCEYPGLGGGAPCCRGVVASPSPVSTSVRVESSHKFI